MTQIKVTIDQENNRISVWNNGKGIPVVIHKEHNVYVPELVFGHLLTSSNYDDTIKKVTGGRNGFGAKLTNIFSKRFVVESADSSHKKMFKQEFKNNLSVIGEAKISDYPDDADDYTEVTFEPDLKKFGMKTLDNDITALLKKRVYDLAGCTPSTVGIYLNGKKITEVKNFESYIDMYFKDKEESHRFYEKVNQRWEVCVVPSE